MRDKKLEVKTEGDVLTISIGIGLLGFAIEHASGLQDVVITDVDKFVEDVAQELRFDEGDGTTPVHRMFDKAAHEAIENGSSHVEIIEP